MKTPSITAMLAAFAPPYVTHVEQDFIRDLWGNMLTAYAPLLRPDGQLEAVLGFDISARREDAYEDDYLRLVKWVCLYVGLGGMGAGLVWTSLLSTPLLSLTRDIARVRNLELDTAVPVDSVIREVAQMNEAVDHMKSGLRSFRKYVPSELVAELMRLGQDAVLSAEKREMTLFFSDIENFTTLSEELPPDLLSARLSDYLKGMTRTLLEHRATVDKFIGDAVMAFWGAPSPAQDHAVLACRSALACQRFIAGLQLVWTGGPRTTFATRIGIHSGEALVGNVGFEERLSYTAIGDTVNTASRLEGLNKFYGTYIMISEVTRAAVQEQFVTRHLDMVIMKGKVRAMAVHELVGERATLAPERLAAVERFNAAMQLYLSRNFEMALEAFRELKAAHPEDRPTAILIERCEKYVVTPPPPEWDGVVHMREK